MNTYATGEKYQISIDTHQELDALLKLIINSQKVASSTPSNTNSLSTQLTSQVILHRQCS